MRSGANSTSKLFRAPPSEICIYWLLFVQQYSASCVQSRPLEKLSMSSFLTPFQSVLHSLLGGLRWGSSWGSVWEMKNVFNTTKQWRNTREWRSLWDRDRLEDRLETHSFALGMRSHSFFILVKTKTRVRVVFPMVYSRVKPGLLQCKALLTAEKRPAYSRVKPGKPGLSKARLLSYLYYL